MPKHVHPIRWGVAQRREDPCSSFPAALNLVCSDYSGIQPLNIVCGGCSGVQLLVWKRICDSATIRDVLAVVGGMFMAQGSYLVGLAGAQQLL
jgi:hypothetical protein